PPPTYTLLPYTTLFRSEHLAAFRAMPNLNLIRPADVNETYAAWKVAIESEDRPTMLVLSRQNLPVLEGSNELAEEGVRKGGYVIDRKSTRLNSSHVSIS